MQTHVLRIKFLLKVSITSDEPLVPQVGEVRISKFWH